MAMLHLIGGDKGGVGKTFVTCTAVQYHLDRGMDFALFDSDEENRDVKRIYKERGCGEIVFSKYKADLDQADPAYEAAYSQTTLVNLPANVTSSLWAWFEENEILTLAKEESVEITHWFVCSSEPDSIRLLDKYLSHFQGTINHVLVKNPRCGDDDWYYLDKNSSIQSKIRDFKVKVLNFPQFKGKRTLKKMQNSSLSFGEAREFQEFNSVERGRVNTFLKAAYQTFDESGVFQC